jgi:hypothetical protein
MIFHPPHGFIETVDGSEFSLGADTDSSYSKVPLPFSKFEDSHKVVDYTQNVAKQFNEEYQKTFTDTVVKYGGVDPDFNFMDFKSEVVAYRGAFIAKKYYGLAKMWDEGTFFDTPELKKTGGQIAKADSTKIIFDLLTEIYNTILLDFSINNEIELYQKIYVEIRHKYKARVEKAVAEMNYHDFGIPKKWGLRELKTIPKQVEGAMLYNYLFSDNIRPGDGVLQCQIITNPGRLLQYADKHKQATKYQLPKEKITAKLNVISFPPDLTEEDFQQMRKVFDELNIRFDLGTITSFNIDMKLDQFKKIFKPETIRMAI